jgi:serine/threonine protein kinase
MSALQKMLLPGKAIAKKRPIGRIAKQRTALVDIGSNAAASGSSTLRNKLSHLASRALTAVQSLASSAAAEMSSAISRAASNRAAGYTHLSDSHDDTQHHDNMSSGSSVKHAQSPAPAVPPSSEDVDGITSLSASSGDVISTGSPELMSDCSSCCDDEGSTSPQQEFPEPLEGSFQCLKCLGKGADGCVIRVQDKQTGELLAAKVFKHGSILLKELELYGYLGSSCKHIVQHRGIIPITALQEDATSSSSCIQSYYKKKGQEQVPAATCNMVLLMELGRCNAFSHMLSVHRDLCKLRPTELLKQLCKLVSISRDIITATSELHAAGVIHGDIKLDNTLIITPTSAKLTDLAGSRRLPVGSAAEDGVEGWGMMTTAGMLPPDAGKGERRYLGDDVWALGNVLLTMFFPGLQCWLLAERSLRAELAAAVGDISDPGYIVKASEYVQDHWAEHSTQGSIDAALNKLQQALVAGSRDDTDAAAAKLGTAGASSRSSRLCMVRQACCIDLRLADGEEYLLAARPYLREAATRRQQEVMARVQDAAVAVVGLIRKALVVDRQQRPSAQELLCDELFDLVLAA